jgi:hypothetical protein
MTLDGHVIVRSWKKGNKKVVNERNIRYTLSKKRSAMAQGRKRKK